MDKCVHINIDRNMYTYDNIHTCDKLLTPFVTNFCRVQKNGVTRKSMSFFIPGPSRHPQGVCPGSTDINNINGYHGPIMQKKTVVPGLRMAYHEINMIK